MPTPDLEENPTEVSVNQIVVPGVESLEGEKNSIDLMDVARLFRFEKLVREAVSIWRKRQHERIDLGLGDSRLPILRKLKRPPGPQLPKLSGEGSRPPVPHKELVYRVGLVRSLLRLMIWLAGGLHYVLGVGIDAVQGRNTIENRARRLRLTFEKLGTTFVKIGQQLSMRLDLLPYEYTKELERMQDSVPAFPTNAAIKAVERAIGGNLNTVFAAFDPEPIGSASVACVFHAVLQSGEHVAVKVRRPGVGKRLAADLRALRWIATGAELLLFVPGFTANFVQELDMMLMEELDLRLEARYAELYRRQTRKLDDLHFVSVPKVFPDYSNDEVLVSEFVTGIWMKDLLPAFESNSPEMKEHMKELRLDRIVLARRIQTIARFNNFESFLFHADLHPGNILVQDHNRIVLIDFGSCGSFSKSELVSWRRWFDAQGTDDFGGMVQAALGILEPLPPIDKETFGMRMQHMFWQDICAIKSKHSSWDERSAAHLWIGFLRLSREFQVPLRLNLLRMIRASMLTDSVALRLDPDQDPYKEFRRYEKEAGWRAEERLCKRVHELAGPATFIRLEQGLDSALKLVYQVQRTVDSLESIRFADLIGSGEYFLSLILRTAGWAATSGVVLGATIWICQIFQWPRVLALLDVRLKTPPTLWNIALAVLEDNIWQIAATLPLVLVVYRLSFRLRERRPWSGS